MNFLYFHYGYRMFFFVVFFLFSQRVQISKTEYKYGQYGTPRNQLDCRYFFVLAIKYNKKVSLLNVVSYSNSVNRSDLKYVFQIMAGLKMLVPVMEIIIFCLIFGLTNVYFRSELTLVKLAGKKSYFNESEIRNP